MTPFDSLWDATGPLPVAGKKADGFDALWSEDEPRQERASFAGVESESSTGTLPDPPQRRSSGVAAAHSARAQGDILASQGRAASNDRIKGVAGQLVAGPAKAVLNAAAGTAELAAASTRPPSDPSSIPLDMRPLAPPPPGNRFRDAAEQFAESRRNDFRLVDVALPARDAVEAGVGIGSRLAGEISLFALPGAAASKAPALKAMSGVGRFVSQVALDAPVDAAIGAGAADQSTVGGLAMLSEHMDRKPPTGAFGRAADAVLDTDWLRSVAADPVKRAAFEAATGATAASVLTGVIKLPGAIMRRVRGSVDAPAAATVPPPEPRPRPQQQPVAAARAATDKAAAEMLAHLDEVTASAERLGGKVDAEPEPIRAVAAEPEPVRVEPEPELSPVGEKLPEPVVEPRGDPSELERIARFQFLTRSQHGRTTPELDALAPADREAVLRRMDEMAAEAPRPSSTNIGGLGDGFESAGRAVPATAPEQALDVLPETVQRFGPDTPIGEIARAAATGDQVAQAALRARRRGPVVGGIEQPKVSPMGETAAPVGLPDVAENYARDLGDFGRRAYRETSIENLIPIIDSTAHKEMSLDDVYMATTPEMALGQGNNRGILIEFDPTGLKGQVNTSKPAWEIAYRTGDAEVIARHNPQSSYQQAVRSFTVKPDAKAAWGWATRLRKTVIPRLIKEGWAKEALPDGSVRYTRPGAAPATAPAPASFDEAWDAAPATAADAATVAPVADAVADAAPAVPRETEVVPQPRVGDAPDLFGGDPYPDLPKPKKPPKDARLKYGRALAQTTTEEANAARAGSPVRLKIETGAHDSAIGAVGTGRGAFARGRKTQAIARGEAARAKLEGEVPDPDVAILEAIEADPFMLSRVNSREFADLRNLPDDEVVRLSGEADDIAYRNQEDPDALQRRAILAGEAKRRGLLEQQPGFVNPRLLAQLGGAVTGAATGAVLDDDNRLRGAVIGAAVGAGAGSATARIDIADLTGKARSVVGRGLRTRGDLPEPVFQRKVQKDARIASQQKEMEFRLSDYDRAVRKHYSGRADATEATRIDAALKGDVPIADLPEPIRESVAAMRQHMDALSRAMVDAGVVEGDLALKVSSNMGTYATRSYRVFDDPTWAKKVPEDVRNKAKALLRSEYPDASEEELAGLFDELLYRGEDGPIAMIQRGKLGSKDLSIVTRRKDIAPEIRALWGEYDDPRVNYARSVTKMAHLIESHKFLQDVMREGAGKFLHANPVVRDGVSYHKKIAADGSRTMEPLNGRYTTPEIEQAFRDALDGHKVGDWMRRYMKVNGTVKFSKTVLSLMTQIRNLFGNTGFAVANGHWRIGESGKAWKAVTTSLANRPDAEFRAYYRELQELGVVGESTHAGELRDVLNDASKEGLDEFAERFAERAAAKTMKVVQKGYQAGDDVWKVYAFSNELARYRKALPDLPEAELKQRVAGIVRNAYPTYSMIPSAVKALRRAPLVGTFVSFPAEVARTGYHTLKLVAEELADPKLRAIGAQRLGGVMAAALGVGAIATASRHITGTTKDEDEDVRRFLASWSQNSSILHLGKDEDGKYQFVDLSYTDPHSYLRKPLIALMRGEDWESALMASVMQATEPFLSEEILAEKLLDISRNTKKDGGQVFNPEAPFPERAGKMLAHVWDALEPGTISSMERILMGVRGKQTVHGRSYDPRLEAMAVFTGHRLQELDVPQALSFRVRDSTRKLDDARRVLTSVASRRGTVSDAELRDAYENMEQARRSHYGDLHEASTAATRLGVEERQVRQILAAAGLARDDVRGVLYGTYDPYRPTEQFLVAVEQSIAATQGGSLEARQEMRRRRRLVQQFAREETLRTRKDRAVLGGRRPAAAQQD